MHPFYFLPEAWIYPYRLKMAVNKTSSIGITIIINKDTKQISSKSYIVLFIFSSMAYCMVLH